MIIVNYYNFLTQKIPRYCNTNVKFSLSKISMYDCIKVFFILQTLIEILLRNFPHIYLF